MIPRIVMISTISLPQSARSSVFFALLAQMLCACAPADRITFPSVPIRSDATGLYFDSNGAGGADFALLRSQEDGQVTLLGYDDDEDGEFDRLYRLSDYDNDTVPHLIIMLDSIPFNTILDYHARGGLAMFPPPVKVIPPFPSMSGVIFTQLLGGPPLSGMINRHYDRRKGSMRNRIVERATGDLNPWQTRLHYRPKYWENGLMFLRPRSWYPVELFRVRAALDESPDRITIAYVASTSGHLSRHGDRGMDEVLAQLDSLCLQLLHERNGALKISILSDHGHNLVPATRTGFEDDLRDAGFRVRDRIEDERDVVCEIDGLVSYVGIHTKRPAEVADVLLRRSEIELVTYLSGERVIVRDGEGTAAIAHRAGAFRYVPMDHDVLGYEQVLQTLRSEGLVDEEGFVSDRTWFDATVDHEWPDAPRRLWDAFHGLAVNTPDLMLTYRDGYCTGLGFLDMFIDMASTHGGLDQQESAAFVMSMTGRARTPLRMSEVMETIEPDYDPSHQPGR